MDTAETTYASLFAGGGGLDPMKTCLDCQEVLPLDAFSKKKDMRDGRQPRCRDCASLRKRAWRLANARHVRRYNAQWDAANRDVGRTRAQRWHKNNPDLTRGHFFARRALIAQVKVETVIPAVVFERDKWQCGICAKPIELGEHSIDHIIPLSRGGEHSYANVQAAHRSCNAGKRDRISA